jgi:hypothetical protein
MTQGRTLAANRMQHPASADDDAHPDDSSELSEDDPYVLAEVARALGPYEGRIAADVFEAMRWNLIAALTTHPVGARLVKAASTAPRVERSGTRRKGEDG